jgi:hypothetical protein
VQKKYFGWKFVRIQPSLSLETIKKYSYDRKLDFVYWFCLGKLVDQQPVETSI